MLKKETESERYYWDWLIILLEQALLLNIPKKSMKCPFARYFVGKVSQGEGEARREGHEAREKAKEKQHKQQKQLNQ